MKPLDNSDSVEARAFGAISKQSSENQTLYENYPHLVYLRAFEDTDLFKRKILAPNRILKINPDLHEIAIDAMQGTGTESIESISELLNIAREIDSPVNEKPINKVFSTLSLVNELAASLLRLSGDDIKEPWERFHEIIDNFSTSLIKSIPEDELEDYFKTIDFTIQRLIAPESPESYNGNDATWLAHRLQSMGKSIEERLDTVDYVKNLRISEETPVSPEQAMNDSKEIAALFQEARLGQAYGVKLAYKQKTDETGSFVFAPPDMFFGELSNIKGISASPEAGTAIHAFSTFKDAGLASIIDTNDLAFKKGMRFKFKVDKMNKLEGWANLKSFNELIGIDLEGELFTQVGTSIEPLIDVAVRNKRYDSYRKLQAEILENYLDLVCPVEAEAERGIDKIEVSDESVRDKKDEQSGVDVVRSLLARRVQKNDTSTPVAESSREVRLHGVVWHIRKLPVGWKPSLEAQELASQAHIILQGNETFVRSHTRGDKRIGKVVIHHLVNRNPA